MLIDFLSDVVSNMDVFGDDILTIYIYRDGGNLVATGNNTRRLLFYKVTPLTDMSDVLKAPVYMGALRFLRSMLTSSLMKESPSIEVIYREHDGKKHCVEELKFSAKRFESRYQCVNPNVLSEKDRLRHFSRPDDAIFFAISKETRKEFDEVARFNTPKADTRLVVLSYDGTYVRAVFGSGTHTSALVLTSEVTGHTEQKFTKLVSLDRFRAMIKLASDNSDSRAGFHETAVWVDFHTAQGAHTIVTPTLKEQGVRH